MSLVSEKLEDDKDKFAWRFTRLTGYKKAIADLANGYMMFNKEGTPIEGKPKLSLLPDIEKELGHELMLYGHSITRGGTCPLRVGPHGASRWRQWFGHC